MVAVHALYDVIILRLQISLAKCLPKIYWLVTDKVIAKIIRLQFLKHSGATEELVKFFTINWNVAWRQL